MFWFFYATDRSQSVTDDFLSDFWWVRGASMNAPAVSETEILGTFFSRGLRADGSNGFILDSGINSTVPKTGEPSPFGYVRIHFDNSGKTVSVERDSLGIGNLYYSMGKDFFLTSTSQKAILRYLRKTGRPVSIDHQAFYESFAYRTTASDRTLVAEISPINFGSEYVFDIACQDGPKLLSKMKKFPIVFERETNGTDPIESYRTSFSEIIRNYPENKDFSVLFTGGLDSTILLHAGGVFKKRVRAVTVMQDTEQGDDLVARQFCETRGIPHEIIRLPNELENVLRSAVRSTEDADSVLCGLSVSLNMAAERAKELWMTTLLSGSYVEPILGSNPSTLIMLKTLAYGWEYPPKNRRYSGWDRLLSEWDRNEAVLLEGTANRLVSVDGEYLSRLGKLTKEIFHGIGYLRKVPIGTRDFFEKSFLEWTDSERCVFSDCEFDVGKEMKLFDLLTHVDLSYRGNIRNNLLNDRIGNALEVPIVPIFAHSNLRNTVFRSDVSERFLPTKYPTTYADNKFFFKRALSEFIPSEIQGRKKSEWSVPLYVLWIFDERNSQFINTSFERLVSRGIFSRAVMELLLKIRAKNVRFPRISIEELLSKGAEWQLTDIYMRAFWKMLALEVWMEEFLD